MNLTKISNNNFEQTLRTRIDELNDLSDNQKSYLKSRWLEQTVWADSRATTSRRLHYSLRIVTIVGGVALMSLANLVFDYANSNTMLTVAQMLFNVVGFLVATAIAVRSLFRLNEHWQHYRHTAELLKSEGWQFIELCGCYCTSTNSHSKYYHRFVERVEMLIRNDINYYLAKVASEAPE